MVDIKAREITNYLKKLVSMFNQNPLLYSNVLYNIGVTLNVIGALKQEPVLSVIGDLLADAPDKIQSIISLRYSLIGTFSELQETTYALAERKINIIMEALNSLIEILEEKEPDRDKLQRILGTLYEELAYTPSITFTSSRTEQ